MKKLKKKDLISKESLKKMDLPEVVMKDIYENLTKRAKQYIRSLKEKNETLKRKEEAARQQVAQMMEIDAMLCKMIWSASESETKADTSHDERREQMLDACLKSLGLNLRVSGSDNAIASDTNEAVEAVDDEDDEDVVEPDAPTPLFARKEEDKDRVIKNLTEEVFRLRDELSDLRDREEEHLAEIESDTWGAYWTALDDAFMEYHEEYPEENDVPRAAEDCPIGSILYSVERMWKIPRNLMVLKQKSQYIVILNEDCAKDPKEVKGSMELSRYLSRMLGVTWSQEFAKECVETMRYMMVVPVQTTIGPIDKEKLKYILKGEKEETGSEEKETDGRTGDTD